MKKSKLAEWFETVKVKRGYLAIHCGVTPKTISNWVNLKSFPKNKIALEILHEKTGLDLDELRSEYIENKL